MTRWSPNDVVPPNPASGSSAAYLSGMSTGSSTDASSIDSAARQLLPSVQRTGGPKGSYAATRWSPHDPVPSNPAGGSSASYLATMSTLSQTGYASSPYSSTAPASYSSLPESAPKKSYAMTKWSPDSSVPPNPASGSSASYLASMSTASSTAPYGSAGVVPAPPPPPVSSGFAASWSIPPIPSATSIGPKGSYAATKWSPNSPVPMNPTSGSSASYLASMSTSSSPSYGSIPSPSWSSAPAVTPEPASSDSVARESDGPRKSYAMTSWSPSNFVPPNPASGSSAAYLASMSTSSTMSSASATPSWSSAPSLTPPALEYASSWSQSSDPISTSEGGPKKSYIMTNWSPNNQVPLNPASGSSASYLASMASLPASMPTYGSAWSPTIPPVPAPEATSFTSSLPSSIVDSTTAPHGSSNKVPTTIDDDLVVSFSAPAPSPVGLAFTGDYLSSLGAMSNGAYVSSVKKSYSMTDWEPGTRVNNAVTNPYLTNMNYAPRGSSVSPFSPLPSYSEQAPAAPAPVPVSYSSVLEPTNGASVSWTPSNGASVSRAPPTNGASISWMPTNGASASWTPTNGASVTIPTNGASASWTPTNGASVTMNYAPDSNSVRTGNGANEREKALALQH
jgi:hypothetical protein